MTPVVQLSHDDRAKPRSMVIRERLVIRARGVLAVADGLGTTETARRVGVSRRR